MIQGAALVYSCLATFVLSSAERNRRSARPHPPIITYAGWTLMGTSFAMTGLLGMMAIQHSLA